MYKCRRLIDPVCGLQAFYAWHEEVVNSYNNHMASGLHRTRLQAKAFQAWRDHAIGVRHQMTNLQAAMLRWSRVTLASAFNAWVDYTSNQVHSAAYWMSTLVGDTSVHKPGGACCRQNADCSTLLYPVGLDDCL